jgi:formate dehydrogenase iron-sulfur subunit
MSPVQLFVPRDAAALAAGADEVADALQAACAQRGVTLHLTRNGSRGLLWLEPLVEVVTPHGRIAYGPVQPEDVPALLDDAHLLTGGFMPEGDVSPSPRPSPTRGEGAMHSKPLSPCGRGVGERGQHTSDDMTVVAHPLRHGVTEQMPYLVMQERLTFRRIGVTDPLSLADYEAHDGWAGLRKALTLTSAELLHEVTHSGLRGRGGAAFPAGIKWKTVAHAHAAQKYLVCNADEGDSGTFADRMVMEGDPFMLIEGMAIAALAVGATQGFIYIRSEYPHALAVMNEAIERASAAGFLGENVLGSGRTFHLHTRKAAGAYVCGEETAMLESLEGKRGIVRAKPPLPALSGLFGQPTVINNVLTLAAVPFILARGAQAYRDYGVGRSHGTLPFQLAGNIKHGGLVEKAFGLSLRELIYGFGGGTRSGRPVKAVQVGGPLGAYVPESLWDVPLDYEAYAAHGAVLGHGGIVVHDDTANLAELARYAFEFCAAESCGKCTPCRIGSTRGVEVMRRIERTAPAGAAPNAAQHAQQLTLLRDLCDTMQHGSLCAMGGMTPYPVLSALNHYPQDFGVAAAPSPQPSPTRGEGAQTQRA